MGSIEKSLKLQIVAVGSRNPWVFQATSLGAYGWCLSKNKNHHSENQQLRFSRTKAETRRYSSFCKKAFLRSNWEAVPERWDNDKPHDADHHEEEVHEKPAASGLGRQGLRPLGLKVFAFWLWGLRGLRGLNTWLQGSRLMAAGFQVGLGLESWEALRVRALGRWCNF